MMMEASPLQLTAGTLVGFLVLLVWVYLAARLGAHGVARSWFEFWKDKNSKGGSDDQ